MLALVTFEVTHVMQVPLQENLQIFQLGYLEQVQLKSTVGLGTIELCYIVRIICLNISNLLSDGVLEI